MQLSATTSSSYFNQLQRKQQPAGKQHPQSSVRFGKEGDLTPRQKSWAAVAFVAGLTIFGGILANGLTNINTPQPGQFTMRHAKLLPSNFQSFQKTLQLSAYTNEQVSLPISVEIDMSIIDQDSNLDRKYVLEATKAYTWEEFKALDQTQMDQLKTEINKAYAEAYFTQFCLPTLKQRLALVISQYTLEEILANPDPIKQALVQPSYNANSGQLLNSLDADMDTLSQAHIKQIKFTFPSRDEILNKDTSQPSK